MRILTSSKVYRAFPELDRFEDERCERFVQAAKSSLWWNWGSKAGLLVVLLLVGAVTMAGFLYVVSRLDQNPRAIRSDAWHVLALAGLMLIALAIPFFVMLVTRDLNLRRRLHHVLRARGTCMGCHYSLVGLGVDERCMVTCPECGVATRVDESLGELVVDGAGRARFEPSADALPEARMWPSEAARRTIKRWITRGVIAGPIVLLVGWGGYEMLLQWQASVARRERPGPGGLLAHVERAQAADAPAGTPDAWALFHEVSIRVLEVEAKVEPHPPTTTSGKALQQDVGVLIYEPREDDDEARERHRLERDWARRFLETAEAEGVFALMDEMAQRRRAVRGMAFAAAQPAMAAVVPELGQARKLARINAARFEVARERGDAAEMGRALEGNLALARMCSLQATMIDGLVGLAIEALAMGRAKEALMRSPSAEMVDAIVGAMERAPPREGIAHTLRGEHLYALDTVCWVFGDPSNVRFGRYSPRLKAAGLRGSVRTPLGVYWQNRDELGAMYAHFEEVAPQEPYARAAGSLAFGVSGLMLLEMLTPAINRTIEAEDQARLMKRGVRVMAALEKYRMSRGEYPDELGALAPEYLSAVPTDPWTGRALGYRRVDAGVDRHRRGYVLYSVGGDRQDDGGTPCDDHCTYAERASGGTDFIINRPER